MFIYWIYFLFLISKVWTLQNEGTSQKQVKMGDKSLKDAWKLFKTKQIEAQIDIYLKSGSTTKSKVMPVLLKIQVEACLPEVEGFSEGQKVAMVKG